MVRTIFQNSAFLIQIKLFWDRLNATKNIGQEKTVRGMCEEVSRQISSLNQFTSVHCKRNDKT